MAHPSAGGGADPSARSDSVDRAEWSLDYGRRRVGFDKDFRANFLLFGWIYGRNALPHVFEDGFFPGRQVRRLGDVGRQVAGRVGFIGGPGPFGDLRVVEQGGHAREEVRREFRFRLPDGLLFAEFGAGLFERR